MKYLKPVELYNEALKRIRPLMGLNIGNTHLGISLMSVPKKPDERTRKQTTLRTENPVSTIQNVVSKYSVSCLVVGYPFRREELEDPNARMWGLQVKNFVKELIETKKFEDLMYTSWDDSLTTKVTFRAIKEICGSNCYPMIPHALEDGHAAFEILEEYVAILEVDEDPASHPRVLQCRGFCDEPMTIEANSR